MSITTGEIKMKINGRNEIAFFVSLVLMSILMAGCMVCDNDVHYTGVEDQQLNEIERGQTIKDWLIETLGEPSEQYTDEEGNEILRYKCTKRIEKDFVLIPPVIVTNEQKTIEHIVAFEVRDDIVQRYWKER